MLKKKFIAFIISVNDVQTVSTNLTGVNQSFNIEIKQEPVAMT